MKELAPGIHSLGNGKDGHVHAFLIDRREHGEPITTQTAETVHDLAQRPVP